MSRHFQLRVMIDQKGNNFLNLIYTRLPVTLKEYNILTRYRLKAEQIKKDIRVLSSIDSLSSRQKLNMENYLIREQSCKCIPRSTRWSQICPHLLIENGYQYILLFRKRNITIKEQKQRSIIVINYI